MNIKVPTVDSKGKGRIVLCDICGDMHELGSMIGVESERNTPNMTQLVCSINCLIMAIHKITEKSKPAYH